MGILWLRNVEEDLSNELELHIQGTAKPSLWNLLAVQFILLPYTLGKILLWKICWFWKYNIKKDPITWDDACYLTQTCLKVPRNAWSDIDESTKKDLILKHLWEKENLKSYLTEMRKGSKRRR